MRLCGIAKYTLCFKTPVFQCGARNNALSSAVDNLVLIHFTLNQHTDFVNIFQF